MKKVLTKRQEHQKGESMKFENSLPVVIVITRTRWDEAPRIRHQVTRQLTRFFNVVYIEKHVGIRGYEKLDSMRRESERLILYSPSLPFPVPGRLFINDLLTHHMVNVYLRRKIIAFVEQLQCETKVLINFEFDFPEIMKNSSFCFKIYLCNDEFPRMGIESKNKLKGWFQSKLLQHYENQVIREADKCLAVSYPLRNKLKKVNSDTELFLPGHEFKCLKPVKKQAVKKLPIKIAFMGFVDDRIDSEWLLELLKNQDMFLWLIGPNANFNLALFSKFSNISFSSFLAGEKLQKKLMEMDVLIMPYNTQLELAKFATAPNKFFQYLAAGKPIVISDMPNFIKMPAGVIYRAKTAETFVEKIRQAYAEDNDELVKMRIEIAEKNTWDKRGDILCDIIQRGIELSRK